MRLLHTMIRVGNLERSLRFYRKNAVKPCPKAYGPLTRRGQGCKAQTVLSLQERCSR